MKTRLAGKRGGLAGLLAVALLLAGALGWATRAALRLERERLQAQARTEHGDRMRLALWRLDSRMTAFLAREEGRPFNHYSAVFAPTLALDSRGRAVPPGSVIEPSPLLGTQLPEWVLLHFQTDSKCLESPQVLAPALAARLRGLSPKLSTRNVTPERARLLRQLREELIAPDLLAQARKHGGEVTISDRVLLADDRPTVETSNSPMVQKGSLEDIKDYLSRKGNQSRLVTSTPRISEVRIDRDVALTNVSRNGVEWLSLFPGTGDGEARKENLSKTAKAAPAPSAEVIVRMSPMFGIWHKGPGEARRLMMLRLVRLGEREAAQGILLDGVRLGELLADEVQDLFPGARLVAEREAGPDDLSVAMTALPYRLDPGPVAAPPPVGWSALRTGLALAWAALGIALVAVALGRWSLLDLSERRFRFVSAVTHELRTPLTTLRLYIDLMLRGVVSDGAARSEYLKTMSAETDRLAQLITNVLDYSRLEGHRGQVALAEVPTRRLIEEAEAAWRARCEAAGKELVVETSLTEGDTLRTDPGLVSQVLGNLLENACKYSRDAADRRVWLRGHRDGARLVLEVEDRGPGVPPAEREWIFRPFHRGQAAGSSTGGVGLGLALARRWAEMLGGRLTLHAAEGGAAFRLVLSP